jgi:hypothetical protein
MGARGIERDLSRRARWGELTDDEVDVIAGK